MHDLLRYPFDAGVIIKKSKSIKKDLLSDGQTFAKVKIAVLGGSTTHDIMKHLELFLLNEGIMPEFYESEYGMYWEDIMFEHSGLIEWRPDIVYIHTSLRNIKHEFNLNLKEQDIENMLDEQYMHFEVMWERVKDVLGCTIIQNNFEMPFYRLLGNKDSVDVHGLSYFAMQLNTMFASYARKNKNFYLNDINWLSASYGLEKWSDPLYWYMYKYCLCIDAIPEFSYNIASVIKSIYGKNKKALALDLDNTLWGGVIGDDGVEKIEIGHESSMAQAFYEFQQYIKKLKELGILLNISSKNDEENAIAGLEHPESVLKKDDFVIIKANWENKDNNIRNMAAELNILSDSIVFIDDNPVERELVKSQIKNIQAPTIEKITEYIKVIDRCAFFEPTAISSDDKNRVQMYQQNVQRQKMQEKFNNYEEYLESLKMEAVIKDFDELYLQRIVQLSNKSNQFNLTTKRYTLEEMQKIYSDNNYIRLYGKLKDKFGDNGVVTVVIGKRKEKELHIELWLMSCRVLKRNMEQAVMDELVFLASEQGINKIIGYYYKTPKNAMVKDFYEQFGFKQINKVNPSSDTMWELEISNYNKKNNTIKVVNTNE